MVVPDRAMIQSVLAALESITGVKVLPAEGGLLNDMSVADNLSLALRYGVAANANTVKGWEHTLHRAFRDCGMSEARISTIGRELPMNLERSERWLVGFVRHLLRPGELLVLDCIFAGLSRQQANALMAMEAVHHAFYPLRPTLFIDLDAHELPALPDCRSVIELEPAACPS
jgi:ABC-type lipopolysaccharide export system ATPase subunit